MAGGVCLIILGLAAVCVTNVVAQQQPTFFITAPNVLRVGVDETVTVSMIRPQGGPASVAVYLKLPTSNVEFALTNVLVSHDAPQSTVVRVEPRNLARNEGEFQHVMICARSQIDDYNFREEELVLVTYQSGFVFVQTDKPIYTPNQKAITHVISLGQDMLPSNRALHVEVVNPQGISVKRFRETTATDGFLTGEFQFPPHPMFGVWSVVAFYGHEFRLNSTATFEIEEYVLPTFSVKVRPPKYILDGADGVSIEIDAQYVFGKPVIGQYRLKYGVVNENGDVDYFLNDIEGPLDNVGRALIVLADLDDVFGVDWFERFEGKRFHVEAVVTERSTGFSEKNENRTAIFVRTPYVFSVHRTRQYFKKALTVQVKMDLTFANGLPADGVPVRVSALARLSTGETQDLRGANINGGGAGLVSNTDDYGRTDFLLSVPPNAETIRVQGNTEDPAYSEVNQASVLFEIGASVSPNSGDNIVIVAPGLDERRFTVGESVSLQLQRTSKVAGASANLHYMCVTGGKTVSTGLLENVGNNQVLELSVVQEMVPSTRLIVYYITEDGYVIADSLLLDVQERCGGEVLLNILPDRRPPLPSHYRPHERITVEVTAPPSSRVGLLAVDKAVYLLRNKDRLTRRKMFDRMQGYDMGCGPGGGQDTDQMFKDSGLTVLTNAQLDVGTREEIDCHAAARRKRRSVDEAAICLTDSLNSCLADKARLTNRLQTADWSCRQRTGTLRQACSLTREEAQEYERCCRTAITLILGGRSNNDNLVVPDSVQVRNDFRETWFFELLNIPPSILGRNYGRINHNVSTPSSITEWKMTAVSVSPTLGMCVHDTAALNVFQNFFIQLHLPYSVVRLEQIQVVVTVFNYILEPLEITVDFTTPEGLCSAGQPGVPISRRIVVLAESATTTTYVVRPIEVGEFLIRVAAGPETARDIVEKKLRVVAQGVTRVVTTSVTLNPSQEMLGDRPTTTQAPQDLIDREDSINLRGIRQIDHFAPSIPQDFIPETESCSVSMIGNLLGTIAADPVNGLERLIRQPTGCGEQTMLRLGPTLFVYKYLRSVGLDSRELEDKVYNYLADGVQRELTYRQPSGAYAAWVHRPGSTWLTAFVVKVFSQASQFTQVQQDHVRGSLNWIIDNNQREDGAFQENQRVIHQEMIGAVKGDISMTAYVLISFLESRGILIPADQTIDDAITKARQYLETQIPNLVKAYDKAIVAYALALAQSGSAVEVNDLLKADADVDEDSGAVHWDPNPPNYNGNQPFWLTRRPSAISVEITAYALLTQLVLGDNAYAGRIAIWLSKQQNYDGGFVSTQDTVMALQALARYTSDRPEFNDINLDCDVSIPENPHFASRHITFVNDNARVQREVDVSSAIGNRLKVQSTGQGVAKANVELRYNTEESDMSTCPFSVNVSADEIKDADDKLQYLLISVCARYLQNRSTHMSIIEVGLYSGFKANVQTLQQITNSSDLISSYELNDRSVVFYIDQIPNDENLCFDFKATSEIVVGNVQPVPVRVYDYYDPAESCTLFYKPGDESYLLTTLCTDTDCVCSARNCGLCGQDYTQDELEDAACRNEEGYALKVTVVSSVVESGFKIINVTVVPIKTGIDNVANGVLRQLYLNEACKCPRIRKGQTYLMVGSKGLKFMMPDGQEGFKYVIDEQSMIEFWPNRPNDRNAKLRAFQTAMTTRGCAL